MTAPNYRRKATAKRKEEINSKVLLCFCPTKRDRQAAESRKSAVTCKPKPSGHNLLDTYFEEKMEAKKEGHDAPLNPFLKFANSRASWRNGRWHCRIYVRCPGPLPDVLSVKYIKGCFEECWDRFVATKLSSTKRKCEVKQIEIK